MIDNSTKILSEAYSQILIKEAEIQGGQMDGATEGAPTTNTTREAFERLDDVVNRLVGLTPINGVMDANEDFQSKLSQATDILAELVEVVDHMDTSTVKNIEDVPGTSAQS